MTSVFVFGQPYWASRVAAALNGRDSDLQATYVDQRAYAGALARCAREKRPILMRVGYRPGATTTRGRLFDAYWALLSRVSKDAVACHYWIGTDVFDMLVEARAGTLRWSALSSAAHDLHITDAPWLTSELGEVGIAAVTAHLPQPRAAPGPIIPLPADFRVLTYLPSDRFAFYGGDTVMEVARQMPDVQIDVVGGRVRTSPPNVRWHGWVSDMAQRYAETTVVLRVPRHDGLGETVVEGLLHARHVVYTHHLPSVMVVAPPTPNLVVAALRELHAAHTEGRLGSNFTGRDYALDAFDPDALVGRLIEVLDAHRSRHAA